MTEYQKGFLHMWLVVVGLILLKIFIKPLL